jgi:GT2 family glycosyltransferase
MVNVPSVAVVILNYNGKNWLEQFLPQVLTTDYPGVEVIIADNASTDDSISWLNHTYPAIRYNYLKIWAMREAITGHWSR